MTTVQVQGAELYYEEQGDGTPVLLIHGTGCSLSAWNDAFSAVGADHRTIAYDR